MSQLTLAIRFSNSKIWKGKIHKSSGMSLFENIIFFYDEQKLKDFISKFYDIEQDSDLGKHNDYDDQTALFAPYGYGILFIDFFQKKVYSCNDYSGFMNYSVSEIKYELENRFLKGNFLTLDNFIKEENFIKRGFALDYSESKMIFTEDRNVKKIHTRDYSWLFNICSGIDKDVQFEYNASVINKKFIIDGKNDFDIVFSVIEMFNEIHANDENAFHLDYLNIKPRGWDFFQGFSDSINCDFYEDLKKTIVFSKDEDKMWKIFTKKNESEQDE